MNDSALGYNWDHKFREENNFLFLCILILNIILALVFSRMYHVVQCVAEFIVYLVNVFTSFDLIKIINIMHALLMLQHILNMELL